MKKIPGLLDTPVVTQDKFAEICGLRPDQVRGQVTIGNLPTVRLGKLRLINLAKLAADSIDPETALIVSPLVTQNKFADITGLRLFQVRGQVAIGNLATTRVGRLRLVDIAKITEEALNDQ